jgi:group I intron endonuclease
MHYIYTITNLLNYKIYVGQTRNPLHRWSAHKCEVNKNRLRFPIHKAIAKYGIDNFQFCVIASTITVEEIDKLEIYWIDQFDSRNNKMGYNLATGGNVSKGWHHTEESKKKIGDANRGKMVVHSEEWRQQMSKIMSGKVHTKETKAKIGQSNFGMKRSEEFKNKIRICKEGKSLTEETKQKMSDAKLGKKKSEETKKKMSLAFRMFSPEQELEIVKDKKNGFVNKELMYKYNCSADTIWTVLKRNGYYEWDQERSMKIVEEYNLGNISQSKLAKKYGLSEGTVFNIIKNKS